MKKILLALALIGIISTLLFISGKAEKGTSLTEKWSTPQTLKVPESVLYDAVSGLIYVANINGMPTEKNGQGFISRLTIDGRIKDLKWATGLNAPKGMSIYKKSLYVTDIDRLAEINIQTGKIKKFWPGKDSQFLNDIAINAKGTVYVSDTNTKRIYRLIKGSFTVWLEFENYDRVNGMLMDGKTLYAGTAQGILRIFPGTKDVSLFVQYSSRGIDGLKSLGSDQFIVTDWQGKTSIIAPRLKPVILLDTSSKKINAADIEYIADKKLLLIPTFFDNRVVAYKLE